MASKKSTYIVKFHCNFCEYITTRRKFIIRHVNAKHNETL